MTSEEYRAKWELPKGYPMVVRKVSESRSETAKSIGLAQKGQAAMKEQNQTE